MATSPVGYRNYVLGVSPLCSNYWPLNETSGTTRFDQNDDGSAQNLTINGTPTLGQFRGVGYQPQQVGTYDGTDDYDEGAAATPANFRSFMIWVYQLTAGSQWIAAQGGAATYSWGLTSGSGGTIQLTIWQNSGANYMNLASSAPTALIAPRRWHCIAWTLNTTVPRGILYLDGVEVARGTSVAGSYGTTTSMALGRRPDNSGSKWNGLLAHAAYWSAGTAAYELSAHTIADLYRQGRSQLKRQPDRLRAA